MEGAKLYGNDASREGDRARILIKDDAEEAIRLHAGRI